MTLNTFVSIINVVIPIAFCSFWLIFVLHMAYQRAQSYNSLKGLLIGTPIFIIVFGSLFYHWSLVA